MYYQWIFFYKTRSWGIGFFMELIFNLDEASLRFTKDGTKEHGVLLVLGNDGLDVISDWNYSDGDHDGFHKAMESFNPEIYA